MSQSTDQQRTPLQRHPMARIVPALVLCCLGFASALAESPVAPVEVPENPNCEERATRLTHPGGATLATESDIWEFGRLYRHVAGDLTIEGSGVRHTKALACLESVDGALWVMNSPNLLGLSLTSLRTLKDLWIHDNATLRTVKLPALTQVTRAGPGPVGGHLRIQRNPQLESIDAPKLTHLAGALELVELPSLVGIGLPSLQRVEDHVLVRTNASLGRLVLTSLLEVGGSLGIDNSTSLVQVSLSSLKSVQGDLWVGRPPDSHQAPPGSARLAGNRQLKRIYVSSLERVGGLLAITHNATLDRLDVPETVTTARGIQLRDCPRLSSRSLGLAKNPQMTLCGLSDSPSCSRSSQAPLEEPSP